MPSHPISSVLDTRGIGKTRILEIAKSLDEIGFAEIANLIVAGKPPVNQKSAWVFNHAVENNPVLGLTIYQYLLVNLQEMQHDGVKRDVLRGFLQMPLQEEKLGILFDVCMQWLQKNKIAVAVRYNSMRNLERIVKHYPDLKEEFLEVLSLQCNRHTESFKRQASKLIKKNS